jgi:uncharacterized protein (TIGR03435 family)
MNIRVIVNVASKSEASRRTFDSISCALLVAGLAVIGISARAQAPTDSQSKPKFDVTSVKPCASHTVPGTNGGTTSRGRVAYNCQTLVSYVRSAYGPQDGTRSGPMNIEGGPAWVNGDLYEITAKAEKPQSFGATAGPMMQALLEDRFKLKIHRETRQVPVYLLGLTKAGLRLPAAKVECFTMNADVPFPRPKAGQPLPPFCGMGKMNRDGIEVHGSTMAEFCVALSNTPLQLDRRKFIDKTGITGRFDFDLKFPVADSGVAADERAPGASQTPRHPAEDFIRLQGALSKVGLQLTSAKGPDEFLVIDHAEHPTPN